MKKIELQKLSTVRANSIKAIGIEALEFESKDAFVTNWQSKW